MYTTPLGSSFLPYVNLKLSYTNVEFGPSPLLIVTPSHFFIFTFIPAVIDLFTSLASRLASGILDVDGLSSSTLVKLGFDPSITRTLSSLSSIKLVSSSSLVWSVIVRGLNFLNLCFLYQFYLLK